MDFPYPSELPGIHFPPPLCRNCDERPAIEDEIYCAPCADEVRAENAFYGWDGTESWQRQCADMYGVSRSGAL